MTTKSRLHQTQRNYFENVCAGLERSLPTRDLADIVLDRGIALLKQTCSPGDVAERLRFEASRIEATEER